MIPTGIYWLYTQLVAQSFTRQLYLQTRWEITVTARICHVKLAREPYVLHLQVPHQAHLRGSVCAQLFTDVRSSRTTIVSLAWTIRVIWHEDYSSFIQNARILSCCRYIQNAICILRIKVSSSRKKLKQKDRNYKHTLNLVHLEGANIFADT